MARYLRPACFALLAVIASASALAASGWDVENTGEPAVEVEFDVTEGTWMSVDVSPDGKTLLFDMLGDIYSMPASGGEAKAILSGPAMQRDPRFSPDGTQIAFVSDRSGGDNIWIADADGSNQRQVSVETTNALTGPAWVPDGRAIVAARMPDSDHKLHNSELRLYPLAGGPSKLLVPTPTEGENVHEAQLSRDGRSLFYTEKVTPSGPVTVYIDALHSNYAIKQRNLQTGATESLIRGYGGATTPRVSPNGKSIAFVRRVKAKTVLFIYDTGSGEQRPVFDGLDRDSQADFISQGFYYPQYGWFPDNQHIAIWAKGKFWKVDTKSGSATEIPFRAHARHKITDPPRFEHELAPKSFAVRAIRQLAVAPNQATVFNALGRLWLKPTAQSKPTRLTATTSLEFEPAFSPDGQRLAYVEWNDETGGRLKLATAGGRLLKTLSSSGGVIRSPSFSRDGSKLVYAIDAGDRCLGGHEATPGIYWLDLKTQESHFVGAPGEKPMFSPDGLRIYATFERYHGDDLTSALESVDLNGLDRRVHVKTPDADTSELRFSPDLQWIAFRDRQQYYVARYHETGSPVELTADTRAFPVEQISDIGGYSLVWSADSSRLYWSVGEVIYSAQIAKQNVGRLSSSVARTAVGLEVPADRPSGSIAFVNARIITMNSDEVIERGTIVIDGNRIAAVGPSDSIRPPSSARLFDAAGKTIMPGLVDMHGHIDNCYYTSSGLMPQKQQSRYADLAFGVTTNYDPYTAELPSYSQAEMTLSGDMVGPRAIESGFIAFGRPGKGDHAYLPINTYGDAQAFMQRKAALGGLIVKSYRQPMRSQRQQLIKAGREQRIMVDVEGESHFYNNITMILDGNTNIQHNLPVANYYDDVVQLLSHSKTAVTPTLVASFGELFGENYIYQNFRVWDDPKVKTFVQVSTSGYNPTGTPHYAPPHVRGMTTIRAADELWDIGFRSVSRSVKRLDDAGVTVNAGSHGQLSGYAQHWEMWLLAEGGMSNLRVLRSATYNGAKTLGLDAQIGSLEVGKLADLIVLDRNPLENIHNTNSVSMSMINGRLYDANTMNEIGNYDRPRAPFYWEVGRTHNIVDWKKAWAHQ